MQDRSDSRTVTVAAQDHLGEARPVLEVVPRTWTPRPRGWRVYARHALGGFLAVVVVVVLAYLLVQAVGWLG